MPVKPQVGVVRDIVAAVGGGAILIERAVRNVQRAGSYLDSAAVTGGAVAREGVVDDGHGTPLSPSIAPPLPPAELPRNVTPVTSGCRR